MASAFRWKGAWNIKWRDAAGRWQSKRSSCETKAEAKRLAIDLEKKAERQREGLEPLPGNGPRLTFGELLEWWWKNYGRRLRSPTVGRFAEKHLKQELGQLALAEVTTGKLEGVLNSRAADSEHKDGLSPASINHLRGLGAVPDY